MKLRPYQVAACEAAVKESRHGPALVALPTGTGKTALLMALARRFSEDTNKPTLVLTHTDEIAQQCLSLFHRSGFVVYLEKAASRASPGDVILASCGSDTIVVGSVQSLRGSRLRKWPNNFFGGLLVDEAHHSPARTWRAIIDYFSGCPKVGVTATATRRGLGRVFSLAYSMTPLEAVEDGWLTPARFLTVSSGKWDLGHLKKVGRDVTDGELSKTFGDGAFAEFVGTFKDLIGSRQAIAFLPGVASSEKVAEWLQAASIASVHVSGETERSTRQRVIRDFRESRIQVLSNCGVLTEGFDAPGASVIGIARQTKSPLLAIQMLGRGLRPLPGVIEGLSSACDRKAAIAKSEKPFCTILDFRGVGAICEEDFIHPVELLYGDFPNSKRAIKRKERQEYDYDEIRDEAIRIADEERKREAALAAEQRRRIEVEKARRWEVKEQDRFGARRKATTRQRAKIWALGKEIGIPLDRLRGYWDQCTETWSAAQASAVISKMEKQKSDD